MKIQFPSFRQFGVYPLSDIPNQAGFRLTLLTRCGDATGAVVACDANGLHFCQSLDGHRLILSAFTSWTPAPDGEAGKRAAADLLKGALAIGVAIVEAVKAAGPLGAPAGLLFAALSSAGCTQAQFEKIMGGMVAADILRKSASGQLYTLGPVALKGGRVS